MHGHMTGDFEGGIMESIHIGVKVLLGTPKATRQ